MSGSRVEDILESKSSGTTSSVRPQSRIEKLLMEMDTVIGGDPSNPTPIAPVVDPGETYDFSDADTNDVMSVISTEND